MTTYTPNMSVMVPGQSYPPGQFPSAGDPSYPEGSSFPGTMQPPFSGAQPRTPAYNQMPPQVAVSAAGFPVSVNGSSQPPFDFPPGHYSQQFRPGVEQSHPMTGSPRPIMMPQAFHHHPNFSNGPPPHAGFPYSQRMPYTAGKSGVVHHGPMDKGSMPEGYMQQQQQHSQYPPNMGEHFYQGQDKMRFSAMHGGANAINHNGPGGPRAKSQVSPGMPPPSVSPLSHGVRSPHPGSPLHNASPNNMHLHRPPGSPRGPTANAVQRGPMSPGPHHPHPHMNPVTNAMRHPNPGDIKPPHGGDALKNGITPNMTTGTPSNMLEDDIKNSASSSGHLAYSKQYELGDEPERKKFLDTFKDFMDQNGTPVLRVPMADNTNNIPLDLYKLYREVCQRNGLPEVNKSKGGWNEIAKALLIKDDKSAVNFLRKQYIKYLFAFECKFDHSLDFLKDHGPEPLRLNHDIRSGPQGGPDVKPPVTAVKRPPPTNGPPHQGPPHAPGPSGPEGYHGPPNTFYNGPGGPHPGYYPPGSHPNEMAPNGVPPNATMPPGYMPPQGPEGHPGYPRPHMGYPYQFPPGHAPGPQGMYMRGPYPQHPENMGQHPGQHPGEHWRYRQPFPGGAPSNQGVGPTFYGEQQIQRYPANAIQPPYSPSSTPRLQVAPAPTRMNNLGKAKSEKRGPTEAKKKMQHPPHMPSSSNHAPPMSHNMPPHMQQSMHSMNMSPGHGMPMKQSYMHSPSPMPVEEFACIEDATPVLNKRRKLTSKDIGYVDPWKIVMSLKSGLLSESTWVLNVLNVLLCDMNMVAYFYLGHHPNLLRMMDRLLDHFQKVIVEMFGEEVIGTKLYSDAKLVGLQPSTKKYKDVAPVAKNSSQFAEEYPSLHMNGLMSLEYIDTVLETNGNLKMNKSYPINLSELEQRFGELPNIENKSENKLGEDKENTTPEVLLEMPMKDTEDTTIKIPQVVLLNGISEESDPIPKLIKEDKKSEEPITAEKNGITNGKDDDNSKDGEAKAEGDAPSGSTPDATPTAPNPDYENISEESLRQLWKRLRGDLTPRKEDESFKHEQDVLFIQSDREAQLSSRCQAIINIFRSLSFIAGNDMILSHHPGFLLMISQMLSLKHSHKQIEPKTNLHIAQLPPTPTTEEALTDLVKDTDSTPEEPSEVCRKRSIKDKEDKNERWCFGDAFNTLREASFCILANISGQLDFSNFNQSLYYPLVRSVVHWITCPSSEAIDPFTPAHLSILTPQRLMLEALSKMSILPTNITPIVKSIKDDLIALFKTLVQLLGDRSQPVSREFALVIMSNLSQCHGAEGVSVAKSLAEFPQCLSLLLKFLEDAEASAASFAMTAHMQGQSSLPPNISQEELCGGTSIDMLRRAALTLIHLAKVKENRSLFLSHQHRVLNLAMSRFTHPRIGAMIADLLFHLDVS